MGGDLTWGGVAARFMFTPNERNPMKKLLLLVVLAVVLVLSSFAAQARATAAVYRNYCWGYEWGAIKQGADGAWYRCTWTGNGYTGFQWWGLY